MTDTAGQVDLANAEANIAASITEAFTDHQPGQTASSPEPEAPPIPATEQTAQPQGEPVAQPEGNIPEGQTTALPDLSTLPADLKKALELYGGDPAEAAKGFLATNTRNAQMAAKLREAGIDPKTLTPYPKPIAPEVPVTPVDEVAINERVQGLLAKDADFQRLKNEYVSAQTESEQVAQSLSDIHSRRGELEAYLKHPIIKADSFTAEEYKSELQELALRELTLKTSALHLRSAMRDLNEEAKGMSRTAKKAVSDFLQSQQEQQQNAYEDAQIQAEAEAEWTTAFPVAISQAVAQFKIPAELQGKLVERAQAIAYMQPGAIDDIHGFVRVVAKQMTDEWDTMHRLKSRDYAQQAIARTQQQPSPSVPSANAYAQPSNYVNMADHEANLAKMLSEAMRG